MSRKQTVDGGKKNEIIDTALQLFLENGYDGTTVRMIQRKVGSEVGLFYYYFKNKDDLFDAVLDRFFDGYIADFRRIVDHGRRNPCRVMADFFEYMGAETAKFRVKYASNIHRTMRWAIREHTLTIIEPFLREVVEIQSNYYGTAPVLQPDVAALFLTHGTGSSILHEDHVKFERMRTEIQHGISLIMGMPPEEQELRIPVLAVSKDISGCMELAETTKNSFPGFESKSFSEELQKHIINNETWLYRVNGEVVAMALYSQERRELDYLSVHPDFRCKGLASRLIETVAAQFPVGTELSVVTYRADDTNGQAAAKLYEKTGFREVNEVTVFGYPCRRMLLTVPDGVSKGAYMKISIETDATACVKSTCYNMRKSEYDVTVLSDCITSYDKKKIDEMLSYYEKQGCKIICLGDFLK